MADIKSFAQPTNTTLYTDVVDTERGFHAAHATMVHNGYASPPVGAVNLNTPGGATRSFTQWDGAAYTNVILNSPGGYQAPTYSLGLANCNIAANIGTGNPGFLFDAGDSIDYDRAGNAMRALIGGVAKLIITSSTVKQQVIEQVHEFPGDLYKYSIHLAAPLNQKISTTLVGPSSLAHAFVNDTVTDRQDYDVISRSGISVTTRRLNQSSGRLLVGQGVTDDGVTALQTTSYSASNQPALIGSGNLQSSMNTPIQLQITTFVLKGGVTLQVGNSGITAPVAGTYMLLASVFCSAPILRAEPYLEILKNGVLVVRQGSIEILSTNTPYSLTAVLAIAMLPGDYVAVRIGTPTNDKPLEARFESVSFTKLN